MAMFKIRVVNPGKSSDDMRNKKGQFTKGSGRRRRKRRANPERAVYTPNPRRRRRRSRRRNPAPTGRRRRRRNPDGGGGGGGWGFQPHRSYNIRDAIPFGLSTLAQAWVVRRWGDPWGTGALGPEQLPGSGYAGQAWTLKNYILGAVTGWVGAKVIARSGMLGGAHAGGVWWRASIEHMLTRLLWTEVIARWQWGQQNFGRLPTGSCKPGDIYDDGRGNRWLCSAGGQWVSMQGYQGHGQLVQANALGFGELVRAGPMGDSGFTPMGELVRAGPMGMAREGGSDRLGREGAGGGGAYDTAMRGSGRDAYTAAMVGNMGRAA